MSSFDWGVFVRALPFVWEGMKISLMLTAAGIAGGLVFGTVLAIIRLSPLRPVAALGALYVNTFRSLPLILVLFWFYFLMPLAVGRPIGAFPSAITAFILFEAAYFCEIIRAGITSVPKGQVLAAKATGMTETQLLRLVILPQAFRAMTPILLTQSIVMFQDTSLVYVITLRDFMTTASIVAGRDGRAVELYCFAAVVYFIICFTASLAVRASRLKLAT
ncbi:MAG: glutamate/aspartate transport system permease protein [Alphaproteobacteria bacterium]|nr:glutamate/aspartate transport system permease protein [Alphaproteobacteria bacterium]